MVELREDGNFLLNLVNGVSKLVLIDNLDCDLEVGIKDALAEEDLAEGAGAEDLALR